MARCRRGGRLIRTLSVLAVVSVPAVLSSGARAGEGPGRHAAVAELAPAAYWPADEGEGAVLHDRSGNGRHGRLRHVPWHGGFLHFTGAYQWAELPSVPERISEEFSLGGWVFSRGDSYGRNGAFLIGNSYLDHPERGWWPYGRVPRGVNLRLQHDLRVGVMSGGELESLGTPPDAHWSPVPDDQPAITAGRWHHVMYTWKGGSGVLYIDGRPVLSGDKVRFDPADAPFLVGADVSWWQVPPDASQSFRGTVRDLVLFDRALGEEQIGQLHAATMPGSEPVRAGADAVMVDGRVLPLREFSAAPAGVQSRALRELKNRDAQELRGIAGVLLPVLEDALTDGRTCREAAVLLKTVGCDNAHALMKQAVPALIGAVQNRDLDGRQRAAAALALSEMGAEARGALPELLEVLEGLVDREGERLPRIEDFLRNSLIRALLDIHPGDPRSRAVLGRAYAKPFLDTIDMEADHLAGVRQLVEEGRCMDALDLYRRLPARDRSPYFGRGDPPGRHGHWAYTPSSTYGGSTYRVGTTDQTSFHRATRISPEEYAAVVEDLSEDYPEARQWRDYTELPRDETGRDLDGLFRVEITRTDPDGCEQKEFLQGDWFVFDGRDSKLQGWSLCVDPDGHIHLMGGQHNFISPGNFIPGSFERMGLSRNREDPDFPTMGYWVSAEPGCIESFDFVGHGNNPRNVPVTAGFNYMSFARDNDGRLYVYGRTRAPRGGHGKQSWGLYRYDAGERRWYDLGGYVSDVLESAGEHDAGWADRLVMRNDKPWAGTFTWQEEGDPRVPHNSRAFAWAWQPHFYNYIRDPWGVRFDRENRMHVRMRLRGLGEEGRIIDSQVYAFSDDGGETFHRADGTPVRPPLTLNPSGAHNADAGAVSQWWDLWISLLSGAGF